jgi:hypothetical protein
VVFALVGSGEVDGMKLLQFRALSVGLLWLGVSGCIQPPLARYVYQDGEYGVVAIPVNTYSGNLAFRSQAEALMARHFPEGYEIVRAEEVTEGERLLDLGRKSDIEVQPQVAALHEVVKLVKVSRASSFEEKDKLQARECRIIYRRRPAHTSGQVGQFASVSSLTPRLYMDPNEIMRRQVDADLAVKTSIAAKKTVDHDVQRAAADPTKSSVSPPVAAKPNPTLN